MSELTVLPPSAWDPTIRLDPPKVTQTLQARLMSRAANKEERKKVDKEKEEGEEGSEDEDEDAAFLKTNKVLLKVDNRSLFIFNRMRKTMVMTIHCSLQGASLVDLLLMLIAH